MLDVSKLALPILTAVALLVVAGGCAFLKPAENETHYYMLTASNSADGSANHPETGCVVRLLPVEVANYLQTQNMAVRTGTNEVNFALFHRWAEPLDAGIRRVLAEDLRAAPGIRAVLTDQPAPSQSSVRVISIRVLACEGSRTDHRGSAEFKAVWEITRRGPQPDVVAGGVFRPPPAAWHPGDYSQLARQLSLDLGDFSRVLSNAISRQTADPPAH